MKNQSKRILITAVTPFVLALAIANASHEAHAVSIFANVITDANPSASNPFTAGQTFDANIAVSGIGRGTGITANAGANRYNSANWSTTTLDANDYFGWTLTPNAGFKIDFTNLTGNWQTSASGPASYALRSSLDGFTANIVSGATPANATTAFNLNLGAAAFDNITSAVTFRLYGFGGTAAAGTYSINDFIFDGAVTATAAGNNTTITADASGAFGRVMLHQTPSLSPAVALAKTGSDTTTFTSAVTSGNASGVTATPAPAGSFAAGPQSGSVAVTLVDNANGSGSTGSRSYTLTTDNTAIDSAGTGQGSADGDDTTTISATVVDNRVISASAVNLGNVIVGQATLPQNSTLSTTGDNDNFTAVTVNDTAASSGGATAATGTTTLFNAAAVTTSRSVSGTFATAGTASGSIPLSVAGEGLSGEATNGVAIAFTAEVFNSANASAEATNDDTIEVNLGAFTEGGSGTAGGAFDLYNLIVGGLQTAGLDLLGSFAVVSGDTEIVLGSVGTVDNLIAGGSPVSVPISGLVDTSVPGTFTRTYTIDLRDDESITGFQLQTLTLELTAIVNPVPEPSTIAMLIMAAVTLPLFRRRGK